MKIKLGIIALCFLGSGYAQKAETVHSVAVIQKDISWYETQLRLWKTEVDKNDKNAEAWYNYYNASRALRNSTYQDIEAHEKYIELCHEIARNAYKALPESFEGNHLMWRDSGNNEEMVSYLMKAHEIAPNDSRAFDDLMIRYEVKGNKAKFKEVCQWIYGLNEMPAGMLNWGYNLLSEVDQNAVVFVAGDNDTYGLWLVQQAKDYRLDVTVINTSLMQMEDYRKLKLKELKLSDYEFDGSEESKAGLWNHIFKNDRGFPVYVATSAIGQFWELEIMDKLYLTGLGYKYSEESFDNVSIIRRNYEKRYLIDHLYQSFSYNVGDLTSRLKDLYLPSLIKLCQHYADSEDEEKKMKTLNLIKAISIETGQEEEVKELIREIED